MLFNRGADIALLDLQTGTMSEVATEGSGALFVSTGHVLYGVDDTLYAANFDPSRPGLVESAIPVLEGLRVKNVGSLNVAASDSGSLIYVTNEEVSGFRSAVWVDREGQEDPLRIPEGPYNYPRVSPDGRQVAISSSAEEVDIWLHDIDRGGLQRLTQGSALETSSVWTPDSARVIYRSSGQDRGIFWLAPNRAAPPERLSSGNQIPASVTPDGKQLLIVSLVGESEADIGIMPLSGEATLQPLIATPFNVGHPTVSPDGRWLAYTAMDSNFQTEVWVRPFPTVEDAQWQVSIDGGREPVWALDGAALYYWSGYHNRGGGSDRSLNSVVRIAINDGEPSGWGLPEVLFTGPYFMIDGNAGVARRDYDIHPDGERFLLLKAASAATDQREGSKIVYVQNWADELQRLVPTP